MDSGIIIAIISGVVTIGNVLLTTFLNSRKKKSDDATALENGVQCLLRAEIIRVHDKYSALGYCPIYAKEALRTAYKAYHALGGNDVATSLYEECLSLPDHPSEDEDENKDKNHDNIEDIIKALREVMKDNHDNN